MEQQNLTDTEQTVEQNEPNIDPDPVGLGTTDLPEGKSEENEEGKTSEPEQFMDPSNMPEGLQEAFKRMQASYTKKMQDLSERSKALTENQAKIEAYDRFQSDPAFARQTIENVARQLNIPIGQAQQVVNDAVGQNQSPKGPPPPDEFVEAFRRNYSPEMAWFAEQQAQASWDAQQIAQKPILEAQQKRDQEAYDAKFNQVKTELEGKFPGWEKHRNDMSEFLNFMQSDELVNPKFGSKLEIILRAVTGNTMAIAEANRRMRDAVQNRSSTSTSTGRTNVSNIAEKIRGAKSNDEAFKIAAESALEEVRTRGQNL